MKDRIIELMNSGLFEEAEQYIDIMKDEDPDKWNFLGSIYYYKKDIQKAKSFYEKGLFLNSNDQDLLYNYGFLLKDCFMDKDAYNIFIKIEDKDSFVYNALGDITEKSNLEESKKYYTKSLEIKNDEIIMKKIYDLELKILKEKLSMDLNYYPKVEKILSHILRLNDEKKYIEFLEYWFQFSEIDIDLRIKLFYIFLYKNMKNYQRFSYITSSPIKVLEKYGNYYLNKYYDLYFKEEDVKSNKIKILFILNGFDYEQIMCRLFVEIIENSHSDKIEYHIMSLLNEKEFKNWDKDKKLFDELKLNYYLPDSNLGHDEKIESFYKYISEIKPDICFTQSFYFAPYNIILFPFLKKICKVYGRHITQQVEDYIDSKLDFVYTGLKDQKIECKNIFFHLPPVRSELINQNQDIREKLKIEKNERIIISVGRGIKYKNTEYWKVILKLIKEINDITFVFFGPVYDEFFKEIIPEYLINKKIFFCGVDLNSRKYLKSCDFYINSTPNGGGVSFNEAYYAGLPIITFIEDYSNLDINIETRINFLPDEFYSDAFKIFPRLNDFEGFYHFAKKILTDNNFKDFIQSKRKLDIKELEYKHFVQELENYFYKMLELKKINYTYNHEIDKY